jgi:two-component system sensor kinase FixL
MTNNEPANAMSEFLATADSLGQRIKRLEDEYQAVLDAAVDAVIVIDVNGIIELVNHAGERLFGYLEEDLRGRNVSVLMPEPYRTQHDGYLRRYMETREPHIIGIGREVQARRSDGTIFAADLAVGLVKGSDPQRFVGFIRDITQRKRAQEALLRSESELNTAQAMANIGNYVIHFDGRGKDYRSPQFWRILGIEPQATLADFIAFLLSVTDPADRDAVVQAMHSLDKDADSFDITYRILRPDSSIRYVHHIAQVQRGEHGRVTRHVGTLHDITDRQLAAIEAREMQERLTHFGRISTMGEMAAGIAHEINQPLTAIATYAQGCQRMLANPQAMDADDVANGLKQIENQALRAGEVIRRLRSFVKNKEVRREPVQPNQLLDDLLMLAQTDMRHHDVRIRIEPGDNLPQIQADPVQIQQVILNLVRNSIDAMLETPQERREILLRTQLNDDGDVEFTVADRGPGLSAAAQDKLFDPFFTTKSGGTGLGLPISLSIVRAHGGKVWYRPNEGGGAAFYFSLPAVPAKATE